MPPRGEFVFRFVLTPMIAAARIMVVVAAPVITAAIIMMITSVIVPVIAAVKIAVLVMAVIGMIVVIISVMMKLVPEMFPIRLMAQPEIQDGQPCHDRGLAVDFRSGCVVRWGRLDIAWRRRHVNRRGNHDWRRRKGYPNVKADAGLRDRYSA